MSLAGCPCWSVHLILNCTEVVVPLGRMNVNCIGLLKPLVAFQSPSHPSLLDLELDTDDNWYRSYT